MREGATLVVDAIDEMYEPLAELAEALESTFHEYIQVNAYASWGTSRGFDLHWDDHDVLVLQVAGRKKWSIYGASRRYPLYRDVQPNREAPAEPLWEHTLSEGDLLYIPRGWWHVAVALKEPSLHLTCGISNRTGIDLLNWIADRLIDEEVFRRDLPRFEPVENRAAHLEQLKGEILKVWDAALMERYFQDLDNKARPRPRMNLPWSALPEVLPPGDNLQVRLNVPRPNALQLRTLEDAVELIANGNSWRFALPAESILRSLIDGRTLSLAELYSLSGGTIDHETVRTFLSELVLEGLLVVLD